MRSPIDCECACGASVRASLGEVEGAGQTSDRVSMLDLEGAIGICARCGRCSRWTLTGPELIDPAELRALRPEVGRALEIASEALRRLPRGANLCVYVGR